jgi:CheY-like chemotaxis protein
MKPPEKIPSPAASTNLSPSERQTAVLLAEDDHALRRFLEVVLERAGYKVYPASDGLEAMKVVLANPIDVVVTDAMMPNLTGHELCRFLRNSPALAHLPVILLSALERKETSREPDQADAFLAKPVTGESLLECIAGLLARETEDA